MTGRADIGALERREYCCLFNSYYLSDTTNVGLAGETIHLSVLGYSG